MGPTAKTIKNIFATIVGLLILTLIAWWVAQLILASDKKINNTTPPIPTVKLIPVSYHIIPYAITGYGTTTSQYSVALRTQADAQIVKLLFKQGQHVKKGQLLATLTSSDINNQIGQLRAQMQTSKSDYDRLALMNVRMPGSVAEFTVLKAKLLYEQNQAALNEGLVINNVKAPIDGIISATNLAEGSFVKSGDVIADIASPKPLQLVYQVPSQYADQVALGQTVMFYPNDSNQPLTAKVAYISPLLNSTNYNLTLRANFVASNPLREHLFGRVTQIINPQFKTLAIDQKLIQADSAGFYVFGVDDNKIVKIPFTAGLITKTGLVQVVSGIKPGTLIVDSDLGSLSVGQHVKVSHS